LLEVINRDEKCSGARAKHGFGAMYVLYYYANKDPGNLVWMVPGPPWIIPPLVVFPWGVEGREIAKYWPMYRFWSQQSHFSGYFSPNERALLWSHRALARPLEVVAMVATAVSK